MAQPKSVYNSTAKGDKGFGQATAQKPVGMIFQRENGSK
jgi:hypothetical protein